MSTPANALDIALQAHQGQFDQGNGEPYIAHCLRVAARVAKHGEAAISAALLHDAVEDSPLTIGDLYIEGFPPEVIDAVTLLTHIQGDDYENYLRRIVAAGGIALAVKRADNADNADPARLSTLRDVDPDKADRLAIKYERAYQILYFN